MNFFYPSMSMMKRTGILLLAGLLQVGGNYAQEVHAVAETEENITALALQIGKSGQASATEKAFLLNGLDSKSTTERMDAARALGILGDASPEVLERLEEALDDSAYLVRGAVATALLRMGEPGRSLLKKRLETDEDVFSKIEMLQALRSDLAGLKNEKLREDMQAFFLEMDRMIHPDPEMLPGSPIENGTFLGGVVLEDWEVHKENNAEGEVVFDKEKSRRPGSGSLKLEKTNTAGTLYLRSKKTLKVSRGGAPIVRFYFQADTVPSNASLQILFEDSEGNLTIGNPSRGHVAQSQTRLFNTPPGKWDKRLGQLLPAKEDTEYYIHLRMMGDPFSVWIDDIAAPAPVMKYSALAATETLLETTENTEGEDISSPVSAEVRNVDGRPRLFIDDKITVPVLYMNQKGNFGDYAGMEEIAKVPLMVSAVHLTNNVDTRFPTVHPGWEEGEKFDFTTSLEWLEKATTNAPNSLFILNFQILWPEDWINSHPDEVWLDANGRRAYGNWLHFGGFADVLPEGKGVRWWPSPSSDVAIESAAKGIHAFVDLIKDKPYAHRIVGCFISGGHDGQFYTAMHPDFSPPAQRAFKEWLRHRYHTNEKLQEAWKDQSVTFETAEVPDYLRLWKRSERYGGVFLNPATDQRFADHHEFQSEQGLRIRERLADAFKEAMKKKTIGMTWQLGGGVGQGVEQRLLHSNGLDMLVTQPSYYLRQPGYIGGMRTPLASFSLHQKMSVLELDLRTWLRTGGNELTSFRLGAAMNPEMFRNIYRKLAAQMIASGHGFWLYDIVPVHFRDPEMMEIIAEGVRAYEELELANKRPFQPEVAIVVSDTASSWMADAMKRPPLIPRLETLTSSHLAESGVPTDLLYLADLLKVQEQRKYKVIIFMDAFRLEDSEISAIQEHLKKDGTTLIWNYASGYLTRDGLSTQAMYALTGIQIEAKNCETYPAVQFLKEKHAWTKDLEGASGLGGLNWLMVRGLVPEDAFKGVERFIIQDETATPLAAYENGEAAVGVKKFPDWTSVYFGMPGTLDARLLNRIARDAGVHVLADPGVAVEFNGHFLSLHGLQNKTVTVSLPEESIVFDFDSNEKVGEGREIQINLHAGQTRWFRVKPNQP